MRGVGIGLGFSVSGIGFPQKLGPTFWVRADQGIILSGTSVATWTDLSGRGNNLSQSTTASRPTFVAASASYNNQPILQTSATQWLTAAGIIVTPPCSIIVIGKLSAGSFMFAGGANGFYFGDVSATSTILNNTGSAISSSKGGRSPSVFITVQDATNGRIYVSQATASASGVVGVTPETGLTIGSSVNHTDGGNDIAEVFLVPRTLSALEIAAINSYASTRYGLSIGA